MGEAVLAVARGLIGTRFRLHGRDAEGVDCVGLVALAFGVEGIPSGYALRSGDVDRVIAAIEAAGLVAGVGEAGELLLRTGPGQLHLAISTGAGLIHADAMLRRVVERSDRPWPVIGRWQLAPTVIPAKAGSHLLQPPRTRQP